MQRSNTAPWGHKKSSLGQKFRKRNLERLVTYKAITERRERSERRQQQNAQRELEHEDYR